MHKEKKSPLFKKHGSILRHVKLRGVSAQLQSAAAERVKAGKPTSMVSLILLHEIEILGNFISSQYFTNAFSVHLLKFYC